MARKNVSAIGCFKLFVSDTEGLRNMNGKRAKIIRRLCEKLWTDKRVQKIFGNDFSRFYCAAKKGWIRERATPELRNANQG